MSKSETIEVLKEIKTQINDGINNCKIMLEPNEYEDSHELLGVMRGLGLAKKIINNKIEQLEGYV